MDTAHSRAFDKAHPPRGLGVLMCDACSKPIRDHRVAHPCPTLGVSIIPAVHSRHSDSNENRRKGNQSR